MPNLIPVFTTLTSGVQVNMLTFGMTCATALILVCIISRFYTIAAIKQQIQHWVSSLQVKLLACKVFPNAVLFL